ncbi:hypothetical protein M9Y10_019177 [Tritrichomonas musculus]|uniref:Inhibitor of growth protein N-terminal histone-binding domain-containing protein n=1 Tax=Tritrichomonas musculus TaxID=1915356 RepID=A0ABR2HIR2_9EUKA
MLSDDDFYDAEINELKNENPELEEYHRVFQKIKEALKIEIQQTKKQLFDKLDELNSKTEEKFNALYKSCNKNVRKLYDLKYNTKEVDINAGVISDNNRNVDSANKIHRGEAEKDSSSNSKTIERKQEKQQESMQTTDKYSNNDNNESKNSSSQEYSDDILFGFPQGSEEETEFLE